MGTPGPGTIPGYVFAPGKNGVIPAGSWRRGSGVPADSLGNLGDRYYDTAGQRWYLKRWVGNFSGLDFVAGAQLGAGNADISVEANVYYDGTVSMNRIISNTGDTNGFRLNLMSGFVNVLIGGVGGAGYSESNIGSILSIGWHKISARYRSGGVDVTVDGVIHGTLSAPSAPGADLAGILGVIAGDWSKGTTTQRYKICNARVGIYGVGDLVRWNMLEGSGTSIADASGNGRVGTLNDASPATFWLQTWVPMDLL